MQSADALDEQAMQAKTTAMTKIVAPALPTMHSSSRFV
jgi:hypothetical protein